MVLTRSKVCEPVEQRAQVEDEPVAALLAGGLDGGRDGLVVLVDRGVDLARFVARDVRITPAARIELVVADHGRV